MHTNTVVTVLYIVLHYLTLYCMHVNQHIPNCVPRPMLYVCLLGYKDSLGSQFVEC